MNSFNTDGGRQPFRESLGGRFVTMTSTPKKEPSPFVPQCQDVFLHQVDDVVQPHPEGEAFARHVFLRRKRKRCLNLRQDNGRIADSVWTDRRVEYLTKLGPGDLTARVVDTWSWRNKDRIKCIKSCMTQCKVWEKSWEKPNLGDFQASSSHQVISQPVW